MQPDASELIRVLELTTPLIGFYDAPAAEPFAPLVAPKPGGHVCVFAFYKKWLDGATLHLTRVSVVPVTAASNVAERPRRTQSGGWTRAISIRLNMGTVRLMLTRVSMRLVTRKVTWEGTGRVGGAV